MYLEKLCGKQRALVLQLFLREAERDFSAAEVARELRLPHSTARRQLGKLERDGFLLSQRRGGARLFRVNGSLPILGELRQIAELSRQETIQKNFTEQRVGRVPTANLQKKVASKSTSLPAQNLPKKASEASPPPAENSQNLPKETAQVFTRLPEEKATRPNLPPNSPQKPSPRPHPPAPQISPPVRSSPPPRTSLVPSASQNSPSPQPAQTPPPPKKPRTSLVRMPQNKTI